MAQVQERGSNCRCSHFPPMHARAASRKLTSRRVAQHERGAQMELERQHSAEPTGLEKGKEGRMKR